MLPYLITRYGILTPDLILSARCATKTKEQFCIQTHYCAVGPCTFARILSLINLRLINFIANIQTINPISLKRSTAPKTLNSPRNRPQNKIHRTCQKNPKHQSKLPRKPLKSQLPPRAKLRSSSCLAPRRPRKWSAFSCPAGKRKTKNSIRKPESENPEFRIQKSEVRTTTRMTSFAPKTSCNPIDDGDHCL